MKTSILLLAVLTAGCFADAELAYHDGTPGWLNWSGTYRGTWFDVEDFIPGSENFLVEWVELWFYQHPDRPWDTNQFSVELWNGDAGGPVEFLASEEGTAQTAGVTLIYFDPPVETSPDFWCIVNTEFSAGGWPSLLADGIPSEHSFFSEDFWIWESFDLGDYFMAVGNDTEALSRTSWGAMKTLF